jgi:hypothetical protein
VNTVPLKKRDCLVRRLAARTRELGVTVSVVIPAQ